MYNKVELCGVNTSQLPVLTEEEKRVLLTRAHAGDGDARRRMIEGNLRLVLSVVQRFAQRGENLDDLFQVGCIGLIKAIDNFDPAQPVRFSTYGVPMIIGEIRRFLRDNNALRVSRSLRDAAYRAMQARERLEKQLGREPTMDEIAAEAGLERREVAAAIESVAEPVSLEEPLYTDGGDAMYVIDQVKDTDGEESWMERSGDFCGTTMRCGSAARCGMRRTAPCRPENGWKNSWDESRLWTRSLPKRVWKGVKWPPLLSRWQSR